MAHELLKLSSSANGLFESMPPDLSLKPIMKLLVQYSKTFDPS